jgi:hypothetical protein
MKVALSARHQALKSNREAKRPNAAPASFLSETSGQLSEASVLLTDVEASVTAFTQQLSAGSPTIVRSDNSFGIDTNNAPSTKKTTSLSLPDRSLVADVDSTEATAQENDSPTEIDEKWVKLATKLLKQQIIWSEDKFKRIREVLAVFERAERARDIELNEATRLKYFNEFIGGSTNMTSRDADEVFTHIAKNLPAYPLMFT